jgi:hypothetical protein
MENKEENIKPQIAKKKKKQEHKVQILKARHVFLSPSFWPFTIRRE